MFFVKMGILIRICVILIVFGKLTESKFKRYLEEDTFHNSFLLMTTNMAIFRMDMTTKNYERLPLPNLRDPIAIDYDYIGKRIYWTDVTTKTISYATLDGLSSKTIRVLQSNSIPDGIAVDSVSQLIFYSDTGTNIIAVMTMDGSYHSVIISSDLDEPRAVVIVPNEWKLYWTDWGIHPKIERSSYDGSNRQTIINSNLHWPNAIAVDTPGNTLYWADARTGNIEKSNLDGSNRQTIYHNPTSHFFGLALYGSTLYYTDWKQRAVLVVPASGGTANIFGPQAFGRLNDIHVHDNGIRNTSSNVCTNGHGGCSHICIPMAGGNKKCLCSDGLTCTENPLVRVELVDGPNRHSGRVEMIIGNRRGSVCDDSWDDKDASVICRMLGHGGGIAAMNAFFGEGNSNILLDNVECDGSETSVMSCRHSGIGIHNCGHWEDAGVICNPKNANTFPELRVELVNGPDNKSGRVEIVIGSYRGTVCDDEWDDNDAKVICKMLGYDDGTALSGAHFGQGSSSIFLDEVKCDGTESSIMACRHFGLGNHDCKHHEDASVICRHKKECGRRPLVHNSRKRRNLYDRIVGLPEQLHAQRGFYPWQVGVRNDTNNICGGTILNDRWILSAAHCFHNKSTSKIRVHTGDHDLMKSDTFEQQFELEQLIEHPNFISAQTGYDIALMKVKLEKGSGIKFNEEVQPACLPDAGMPYETGMMCHISGWGKTSYANTGYPTVLRAAEVPLLDDVDCKRRYTISPNMVCAGYMEGGIDTCQGDSGGPLVCSVDGLYYVMGVTSFGRKCGLKDYPGVYAKVALFQSWIETTIASYP